MQNQHQVFVVNCGSSSIKYQLLSLPQGHVLVHGSVEGIGNPVCNHHYRIESHELTLKSLVIADHHSAFLLIIKVLEEIILDLGQHVLTAIGHRVVHGGEHFMAPTRITSEVLATIEQLSELAPLHNPANAEGIRICQLLFPATPQVAVFDTAFHQTLPEFAYRYAIPEIWYQEYHIRRYGFHGSSHRYIAQKAAEFLQKPLTELNLITLHLGNGASACAIAKGVCVDTSMGFTPLEGLVMGTRSGDIDPAITLFLQHSKGLAVERIDDALNHQSGLQGLAGSYDMRVLLAKAGQGETTASLAINIYTYRIKKYIGAYFAVLGQVDGIIFTGGIGENAPEIRLKCCENLENFGVAVDHNLNQKAKANSTGIKLSVGAVPVLVINTNEELQIAHEALGVVLNTST
ncbi:MAG: acetate kinase [Methylococcaceae bacterium]|jgi:acetate kinase